MRDPTFLGGNGSDWNKSDGAPKGHTENHDSLWANKPHEAAHSHGRVGFLELAGSTMDSVLHRDNGYCSSCAMSAN
jgi:hypothetical protein